VTVVIDEEVSYGAPAARFVARLADLMQSGVWAGMRYAVAGI
jgi:hypothetical protein